MENLDSDLLRTFVAVAAAGSMTEGAARVLRSQSAASLQIKRLEAVLGRPVFQRHGRGVSLTETGRRLLPVARDVTERLDGILRDICADSLRGKLRLGLPENGRGRLARIVGDFARSHPLVELEVTAGISTAFPDAIARGRLDLAVYEVEAAAGNEEVLLEEPTCWAASRYRDFAAADPLPVALFDHACWWRDAAFASLQRRGRPYRVVCSSQSVDGVSAAVEAGIAVGLLGLSSIGEDMAVLSADSGFGATPLSKLVLATSGERRSDSVAAMASAIRAAFRG